MKRPTYRVIKGYKEKNKNKNFWNGWKGETKKGIKYSINKNQIKHLIYDFNNNSKLSIKQIAKKYKVPFIVLYARLNRAGFNRPKKIIFKIFKRRPQCKTSGKSKANYIDGYFCKDKKYFCIECEKKLSKSNRHKTDICQVCLNRKRDNIGRFIREKQKL